MIWNPINLSLKPFVFFPFASAVLSNSSWRNSRNITPLLSLVSLPTYARSIHQISFLNLANISLLSNLRVIRENFGTKSLNVKIVSPFILVDCQLWALNWAQTQQSNSFWTRRQGQEQTPSFEDRCWMTAGVMTFMSCDPLLDAKTSLLLLPSHSFYR